MLVINILHICEDFDLVWMHDELESNLVKELDFENEGRNGELSALNFRSNPAVHVPRVIWPLTSKRILAMEYIHGVKVTGWFLLLYMLQG